MIGYLSSLRPTPYRLFQALAVAVALITLTPAQAQTVLPYVDHWDSLKTV